jgi:hypothetical protein
VGGAWRKRGQSRDTDQQRGGPTAG